MHLLLIPYLSYLADGSCFFPLFLLSKLSRLSPGFDTHEVVFLPYSVHHFKYLLSALFSSVCPPTLSTNALRVKEPRKRKCWSQFSDEHTSE